MSGAANLGITLLSESQNQKYLTTNDAISRLANAITETLDVRVTSGNVTLTSDQWRANAHFRAINATVGGRTITVPQNERLVVVTVDAATCTQNVTFVRGSATVVLAPGSSSFLWQNGTSNHLVALFGAGVTPAPDLEDLADVTGPFTVGDLLQYDGAGWIALASAFLQNAPFIRFRGVLVNRNSAQVLTGSTQTAMIYTETVYDTDSFWSAATPSRLTVPVGVTKVRVWAKVTFTGGTANVTHSLYKNGALVKGGGGAATASGTTTPESTIVSAVLEVTPGDYFEQSLFLSAGRSSVADRVQMAIEIVETVDQTTPTFIDTLTDTPADYTGSAGLPVVVNSTEDAVEFAALDSTGIADAAVTLAKMADLAQDRLIGRATASTGVPEAIPLTAAGRDLLDDATAADQRTTLGLPGSVTILHNLTATADPTVNDDSGGGYSIGSMWFNSVTGTLFSCALASAGAAVWYAIGVSLAITYRSGSWIGEKATSVSAVQVVAADTLYAFPVRIRMPVQLDTLAMRIGTGVAANGKMGIYAHSGSAPSSLISQCNAAVSLSGTGSVSAGFSANPWVYPPLVWFASLFDGAAQPVTYNANSSDPQFISELLGGAAQDFIANSTAGNRTMRVTAAASYAAGMPASFGAPSYGAGFPGAPVITARII